jgi:hypothetical protein
MTDQERFAGFVEELASLSVKYGVAVQAVGGVAMGTIERIRYDADAGSGDLTCTVEWGDREAVPACVSPKQEAVARLARTLGFETLDERKRDREDFREVAVWAARAGLEGAYDAGVAATLRALAEPTA